MENIKDTKWLQIQSLMEFAKALNLTLIEDAEGNRWWSAGASSGMERISVNTMIQLHNGEWRPAQNSEYKTYYHCLTRPFFTCSKYLINKAQAAKVVNEVKGKYHRKQKDIVIQSHIVEFVDPVYYELFLTEQEEQ